jgi:endonuclease/exonuclease/phosphatase family metal-dependent hydrolase
MKILCLNIWGGRAGQEKLLDFFESHRDDIDIFCLQEVWSAPYKDFEGTLAGGKPIDHSQILTEAVAEITKRLPNHTHYFKAQFLENYGLMMLIRNDITVLREGDIFVHKHKGFIPNGDIGHCARNLQYVTILENGKEVTMLNFHGLWNGQGKTDSEERLTQSRNITSFISTLTTDIILMGDLNLLPDTESLHMIEDSGLRNLITEYGIQSTRTSFYEKPIKIADYAFVSPGVTVLDFRVLPDEVSDHSPLLLEIS